MVKIRFDDEMGRWALPSADMEHGTPPEEERGRAGAGLIPVGGSFIAKPCLTVRFLAHGELLIASPRPHPDT
jgi:hypothetical protein